MPFGSTLMFGKGPPQQQAPDWNANTGAYKDLYPEQKTVGPGEWGYKDPNEVAKLNQEWFSEHKQASRPQFGWGGRGFGGFGVASELGF